MFRSFKLGSAFGIPLYLNTTFFLLPLYALFLSRHDGLPTILFGQVLLLALFGCVLLHELGHALMARFFGIPTRDITLYPIGGVARLESTGRRPIEELCISLAGPAVNLLIALLLTPLLGGAVILGLLHGSVDLLGDPEGGFLGIVTGFLAGLWLGNLILMVFNLVPVFPMDGGRVLRALLSIKVSHLRATEIAATVGLFGAGCLALAGLLTNPTLILVALFVAFAGQQELAALRRREMEQRLAVEVLPAVDGPRTRLAGFTGFLWDRDNRAWVQWVNGQPIESR
jgi:Zn-dependent protease